MPWHTVVYRGGMVAHFAAIERFKSDWAMKCKEQRETETPVCLADDVFFFDDPD